MKTQEVSESSYLSDRKCAPSLLGNVAVLGLGVSGKAVVEYLAPLLGKRVESITVYAGKQNNDTQTWIDDISIKYNANTLHFTFDINEMKENADSHNFKFDLCIASPGISMFSDDYIAAVSISRRVISEVEFAWSESRANSIWVAITGTNGKTTTTALTAHILQHAGFNVNCVGNIGDACITAVQQDLEREDTPSDPTYFVAETSSFQLASIAQFSPNVSIILGIQPDHVEWHKTYEHYVASKMKLLDNMNNSGGVAILDATNDEVRSYVKRIKSLDEKERGYSYIPIATSNGVYSNMQMACGAKNAAFVDNERMFVCALGECSHILCSLDDIHLKGEHNYINVLAASSAATVLGVSEKAISQALASFQPLPHRIEPVKTIDNISFYNDSKATNVDSTICALRAFGGEKVAVMLGGHDKMTPLDDLVESCREHACIVVCFGEAKERFYEALAPLQGFGILVLNVPSFDEAFHVMVEEIHKLNVQSKQTNNSSSSTCKVALLSPACSSYDEFSCFEQRGEHFKELVLSLK